MDTLPITTGLISRSDSACELCGSAATLSATVVPPRSGNRDSDLVVTCQQCRDAAADTDNHQDHWRCLSQSMWNQEPAVQVLTYRLLNQLSQVEWAASLLSDMYMEEATREWAEIGAEEVIHLDAHGARLSAGDSVVLIKDLAVKGGGFTAKRGTVVRRISLVRGNTNHIEGRVNDQHIVILTQYVKKS